MIRTLATGAFILGAVIGGCAGVCYVIAANSIELDRLSLIIQGAATIVIPVVVLLVGNWLSKALKEKDLAQRYVQIAVDVLKTKVPAGSEELREWAVKVLNKYSAIPLPDKVSAVLKTRGFFGEPPRAVKLYIVDENGSPITNGTATIVQDAPNGPSAVASVFMCDYPNTLELFQRSEDDYFVRTNHPDYEDHVSDPEPLDALDGKHITLTSK